MVRGVLLFSVRPVASWLNVRRLKRVGTSPVAESVQEAMQRIAARLQVQRRVEILASTVVTSPIVVGCFRSLILLPTSFIANVPASQLEAILAHELAHVRRYDYLVNLVQTLIETLFFYHPAVWWLSHRIRIERENCCDDLVVATFANKADYGRALLAVEQFRNSAAATPTLAVSAKGGSLLTRVRRLVHTPGHEESAGGAGVFALATLMLGIVSAGFWVSTETQANDEQVAVELADEVSVERILFQPPNNYQMSVLLNWSASRRTLAPPAKVGCPMAEDWTKASVNGPEELRCMAKRLQVDCRMAFSRMPVLAIFCFGFEA